MQALSSTTTTVRRKRTDERELRGLTEFFILIAVIISSLLLLNIALIYGADYSQQWQPVMSNVDSHLALMEMYG